MDLVPADIKAAAAMGVVVFTMDQLRAHEPYITTDREEYVLACLGKDCDFKERWDNYQLPPESPGSKTWLQHFNEAVLGA